MVIFLDYINTLFEPNGRCVYGCFEVISELQKNQHKLVLNTSLSEYSKKAIDEALDKINNKHWMFLKDKSVIETFTLKPIGALDQKIRPLQYKTEEGIILKHKFSGADEYLFIDDDAVGIPLKDGFEGTYKVVDWDQVHKDLLENNIIK